MQELVKILEKVTGKKVILEFVDAPSATPTITQNLSARRAGAQKAIQTKGQDDWSPEQYALCYFLIKYGKSSLPEPYRTMTFEQLADAMGVKKSTLSMNGENVRYALKGESHLMSASPKVFELIEQFEKMDKSQVLNLIHKGFDTIRQKKVIKADPRIKPGMKPASSKTAADYSPEVLAKINAARAARGEAPLA